VHAGPSSAGDASTAAGAWLPNTYAGDMTRMLHLLADLNAPVDKLLDAYKNEWLQPTDIACEWQAASLLGKGAFGEVWLGGLSQLLPCSECQRV
jgi:hypothetical protein